MIIFFLFLFIVRDEPRCSLKFTVSDFIITVTQFTVITLMLPPSSQCYSTKTSVCYTQCLGQSTPLPTPPREEQKLLHSAETTHPHLLLEQREEGLQVSGCRLRWKPPPYPTHMAVLLSLMLFLHDSYGSGQDQAGSALSQPRKAWFLESCLLTGSLFKMSMWKPAQTLTKLSIVAEGKRRVMSQDSLLHQEHI